MNETAAHNAMQAGLVMAFVGLALAAWEGIWWFVPFFIIGGAILLYGLTVRGRSGER